MDSDANAEDSGAHAKVHVADSILNALKHLAAPARRNINRRTTRAKFTPSSFHVGYVRLDKSGCLADHLTRATLSQRTTDD